MEGVLRSLDKSLIERIPDEKKIKKMKGATGFEPVTSRSAVECSTTELYPLIVLKWQY